MSNRFRWVQTGVNRSIAPVGFERENKFSAHFPFPDGEIIFTFEHTNYAGETLTLSTFLTAPLRRMVKFLERHPTGKCQEAALSNSFFDASPINVMIYSFRPSKMKEWAAQSCREWHKKSIIFRYRYFRCSGDGRKQIKFTESSRIPSPNPDSINGWAWRSAKVTKAPHLFPLFFTLSRSLIATHHVTLFEGDSGKTRGATQKDFSVDICERVELIVMRRLLRARLEKFSLTGTKESIKGRRVCECSFE